MTNNIQPFSSLTASDAASASQPAARQPATTTEPAVPATQTDSVTLSAAAQASTALLTAARGSSGINQPQVSAIKAALANGSYNVSPEDLAQAISTVLNEAP